MTLKLDHNPLATEVQTRDGRKARIICADRTGGMPVVALINDPSIVYEIVRAYDADGKVIEGDTNLTKDDLVNIPMTWWINVYDLIDDMVAGEIVFPAVLMLTLVPRKTASLVSNSL